MRPITACKIGLEVFEYTRANQPNKRTRDIKAIRDTLNFSGRAEKASINLENPITQILTQRREKMVATEFLEDYKQLQEEKAKLQRKLDWLEIQLQLHEKAIEFLAERLDEATGGKARAKELVRHILQK